MLAVKQPYRIALFDGHCLMCQGLVQFIIKRDPAHKVHFASLQSEVSRRLLQQHGIQVDMDNVQTFIWLENGKAYTRSTAALRVVRHLKGLWPLLYILILVPPPLRNTIYTWVAEHRYRWFGKSEQCMLPSPDMQARFIEDKKF